MKDCDSYLIPAYPADEETVYCTEAHGHLGSHSGDCHVGGKSYRVGWWGTYQQILDLPADAVARLKRRLIQEYVA